MGNDQGKDQRRIQVIVTEEKDQTGLYDILAHIVTIVNPRRGIK